MTQDASESELPIERRPGRRPGRRLLGQVSIFGGLRDESVALLLERSVRTHVAAGEFFFQEGERGTSAFVLETGRVSIIKQWNDQPHVLRHLAAGDCFGEVALIDFGARSASVRADVDCSALEFTAADLLQLARSDPEQFAVVYMNLARELARRLRAADDRLFRARLDGAPHAADHRFDAG
ncbi:MAG: Crp/Fnr family transcriptional regulator [Myxococcota bacterium]